MTEIVAPTIDDARAAGCALIDAGAREVLAYGSVVVGGADPVSDIDLVAVFDDVDYNQRWRLRLHLLDIACDACGHYMDILVTDVPEWAAQNKMVSSFAAAIRDDLVVVAAGPRDDSAVVWDKPQALPDTDIEAAYYHLNEAVLRRDRMSSHIRSESRRRNVFVSWAATDVIKEALRALGAAALIDAKALHCRDIATVVAHLPGEDRTAVRTRLDAVQVSLDDVTMWWASRRAFGKEHRWWRMMPDDYKIATAAGVDALTVVAMDLVEYASERIADLHGRREVNDWIEAGLWC